MAPRTNSLKRRFRSAGGKLLRRFGMLPGGMPDGLGDEATLEGTSLGGQAVVFFPDTADALYQVTQWYGPFERLHRELGLTIVCMDSRTAAAIRGAVSIPVITIAQESTLDDLVARSGTKLVFYVNYNPLNFLILRLRSVIHVSLLHGDSDKSVSISNQVKAFDFSFVAGQAAIDRFERYTSMFDAAARCIPIGRPYLDTDPMPAASDRDGDTRPVVLYAPTWEGGQATVAYSSLASHGLSIVKSLIASGIKVIYRPHPLTGVRIPEYGEVDSALRELLGAGSGHVVSDGTTLFEDFAAADLLIGDVSVVPTDWLATGKPMVVTTSSGKDTREAATRLLQVIPRLAEDQAPRAGELALAHISADPLREERAELAGYYFGSTEPGASLDRFLTACRDLADRRDREWARIQLNESPNPDGSHERAAS